MHCSKRWFGPVSVYLMENSLKWRAAGDHTLYYVTLELWNIAQLDNVTHSSFLFSFSNWLFILGFGGSFGTWKGIPVWQNSWSATCNPTVLSSGGVHKRIFFCSRQRGNWLATYISCNCELLCHLKYYKLPSKGVSHGLFRSFWPRKSLIFRLQKRGWSDTDLFTFRSSFLPVSTWTWRRSPFLEDALFIRTC